MSVEFSASVTEPDVYLHKVWITLQLILIKNCLLIQEETVWLTCKAANHSLFCFYHTIWADIYGSWILPQDIKIKKLIVTFYSQFRHFFSIKSYKKYSKLLDKNININSELREISFNYLFYFLFCGGSKKQKCEM